MGFFDKITDIFSKVGNQIANARTGNEQAPSVDLSEIGKSFSNKSVNEIESRREEQPIQQQQQQEPAYRIVTPGKVFEQSDQRNAAQRNTIGSTLNDFWTKQYEPEYANVGHRGRDNQVVDVDEVELSPEFSNGSNGKYDPSLSTFAKLDSLGDNIIGGEEDLPERTITDWAWDIDNSDARPTTETNELYESLFDEQEYTPGHIEDQRSIPALLRGLIEAQGVSESGIGPTAESSEEFQNRINATTDLSNNDARTWLTQARESAVDDGRMDERNLTSNYMTGDRYLYYINNGVPNNLTEEQIEDIRNNPTGIYNKRNEMFENGFTPYIPSDEVYDRMIFENAVDQPTKWWEWLRSLREANTDYTINLPDGRSMSGRERDGSLNRWGQEINKEFEEENISDIGVPESWTDKSIDHTGEQPISLRSSLLVDIGDGNSVEIPGDDGGVWIDPATGLQLGENDIFASGDSFYIQDGDGGYVPLSAMQVQFNNGVVLEFDAPSDYDNFMASVQDSIDQGRVIDEEIPLPEDADPDEVSFWYPVYEAENGDVYSFQDASDILNGSNEIQYNYGPANIAKPQQDLGDFWGDNGFNWSDFVPKSLDMLATSVPYFDMHTSIPLALSTAHQAAVTANPAQMNSEGVTVPLSEDISNDRYATAVGSNLIMPFTELGFGRIGNRAFRAPFLENGYLANRFGERAWFPAAQWLLGTTGEGVEEIYGNAVEEGTNQGLKTWYGDPIMSEGVDWDGDGIPDGQPQPMKDPVTGLPLKDPNTPVSHRFMNFLNDIPEAFTGGAILGGGMSFVPGTGQGLRPEVMDEVADIRRIINKNRAARAYGYKGPITYGDFNINVEPMSEEDIRYFNYEE